MSRRAAAIVATGLAVLAGTCRRHADPFDEAVFEARLQTKRVSRTAPSHYGFLDTKPFFLDNAGRRLFLTPLVVVERERAQAEPAKLHPAVLRFRDYVGDPQFLLGPAGGVTPGPAPGPRVDRRTRQTPVKEQGARNTCVAFASVAALENFASVPDDLSEQDVYHNFILHQKNRTCCSNSDIASADAPVFLAAKGAPEDAAWPYTSSRPPCLHKTNCGAVPHQPVDANPTRYRVAASTVLLKNKKDPSLSITNPAYLESLIFAGKDVVLGVGIAWDPNDFRSIVDVVKDPVTKRPLKAAGGHAVLLVGYVHDAAKPYFIAKDSQGVTSGHEGYLYISYDYVRRYALEGFVIDAVEKVPPR